MPGGQLIAVDLLSTSQLLESAGNNGVIFAAWKILTALISKLGKTGWATAVAWTTRA